ncbi:WD40/YVTN/BNR-like repeat-containing protein [Aureispira anguillae]|nr:glycosyl hydrolase [Aureispira anguillae]
MNYLMFLFALVGLLSFNCCQAQNSFPSKVDSTLYDTLQWRNIGPFRGGRSCAVTGVEGDPNLFYFGAAGGGIWKTKDGGRNWNNISDGFFGGSVGAIAVSKSDPNVIYVGGGEKTVRGNVSIGYGIWKSENAGKTWVQKGLKKSRQIARVRVHPKNHNVVYAAAMGNLFKPNAERGVFKSIDGGDTWKKVLFVNDEVGAVDLVIDPSNPRILYATTWRIQRTPYSMSSGGEGCGIWKSTDHGETWKNITKNKGLPKDTLGIIGITVSPANPERVWAIIESKTGGVFRSDNGGDTWVKTNDKRNLRQRAWYYSVIQADPKDAEVVYVLNVRYHRSEDGGRTFKPFSAPHVDHHDLWIDPENPKRMIIGDDGGAQVSYDRGTTWSTYHNQPTAQFYRITTDNHFPYRIYAAQQDNSTVRIPHRTRGWGISDKDWEPTAGCECGHIAVDPLNSDIVYGGCYDGYLQRKNHKNGQTRAINVWPDNPMGHGAEATKYRFQWNFPLFFSPHDPKKLYTASNHLHVTYNEGQSWETISPDLTTNDSTKQKSSGGPITQDNTSVEYYCTIFAACESPRVKDLLWTGSDDGLIHISRDGGKNWDNVTPSKMPKWMQINSIEADPFNDGGLYVAGTRYKLGDFKPYLYYTKNYGADWVEITNGIAAEHFTRVIRADPKQEGLLYAGTESGIYISYNNGKKWHSLQLNLPIVPITDMVLKENDLIVATQGRSIWILDDIHIIRQATTVQLPELAHLYTPSSTYRMGGGQNWNVKGQGINHRGGVVLHYYLNAHPDSVSTQLYIVTEKGDTCRTFDHKAKKKENLIKLHQGAGIWAWNMNYPSAKTFPGMINFWASMAGPRALPGQYKAILTVDSNSYEVPFEIINDPDSEATFDDLKKQFDFVDAIRDKLTETHQTILDIRTIRKQLNSYNKRLTGDTTLTDLLALSKEIDSTMTVIEKALYQTQNKSPQDPLNFPIRLNNKLGHLNALSYGDYPPTDQALAVKAELFAKIDALITQFKTIKSTQIKTFNQLFRAKMVEAIWIEED